MHPLITIGLLVAVFTVGLSEILAISFYSSFAIVVCFGPALAVGLYLVYGPVRRFVQTKNWRPQ